VEGEISEKAVVLLSGGIDSTVTLYLARREFVCSCIIFDYGQRHRKEIHSAKSIAEITGCEYKLVKFNLPWDGSALLDGGCAIPKNRLPQQMKEGIPPTYVPARNTIFLSFALSFAETIGASLIFIGANHIDYSGYPDCRPSYFEAYEELIKLGTKVGVEGKRIRIEAPLIEKTKGEIITLGAKLGVPFDKTWSCYEGGEFPCGGCDSCLLRTKGFAEAKVDDPLLLKVRDGGSKSRV
jgi:7-cyano-7-deazaguanine synthase